MVHPSPNLLFRPIPALQKIFTPPAPLPLEPRESKRLLNLLTTSFRQQLEREHERTFRVNDADAKLHIRQKPSQPEKTDRRRLSTGQSEFRSTDRHLQSVLTNPLFSYGSDNAASPTSTRDPMETFDKAVSRGLMKLQYAKGCLVAKKRKITESSELSIEESMRASGAGLKVLKWLKASGVANSNEFLFRDDAFTKVLMEFMVAEDLQEVSWAWIQRELDGIKASRNSVAGEPWIHTFQSARLLKALVQAETTRSVSLDAAYHCMIRAASKVEEMSPKKKRSVLSPAANLLFQDTLLKTHKMASPSGYDSFLGLVVPHLFNADFKRARLDLHHPTHPTAASALEFFRRGSDSIRSKESSTQEWTQRFIMLGIDAANHLLEHDQHNDAKWLMKRLQSDYSEELGLLGGNRNRKKTKEIEDALNVNLLASLDLA